MSADHASIPGQMDLAANDNGGEFHLALSISEKTEPKNDTDVPLPRPKRRPRRAKADRGLPPDEELARLANAYLEQQRKHWPEIVQAGRLPEPTDDTIRQMVGDFKNRHRGGKIDPSPLLVFLKYATKLGGNYNRFSCDNSSPLSIIDQMVNALSKACTEKRFVPWSYIFCDYSVTGLDASRQGYTSYKTLLADKEHPLDCTYIDDFSRASRDSMEWWKLGHCPSGFASG